MKRIKGYYLVTKFKGCTSPVYCKGDGESYTINKENAKLYTSRPFPCEWERIIRVVYK